MAFGVQEFLNLGPSRANNRYSITGQVVYLVRGVEAVEQGEPSTIPISCVDELPTAVRKAASVHATHQRADTNFPIPPQLIRQCQSH